MHELVSASLIILILGIFAVPERWQYYLMFFTQVFLMVLSGLINFKDTNLYPFRIGSYLEGAIGYYKQIKNYYIFEIYTGLGGSTQHHEYARGNSSDISYFKLFAQPSFGVTYNHLEIAVSARANLFSYGNAAMYGSLYSDELKDISGNSYFLLEPAATLRLGWENIKLQLQAGCVIPGIFLDRAFSYEDWHLSAGLYVILGERYKNK